MINDPAPPQSIKSNATTRYYRQATQGFDVLDLAPDDHYSRDCEY